MSIDKLLISNLALGMLKAKRITAFPTVAPSNPSTEPEATLVFDWYDIARDETLGDSKFAWSFATKTYALVLAATQPTVIIDGLTVLYQLPNTGGLTPVYDMIVPTFKSHRYAKLVIQSEGIYSNTNDLLIKYTFRNDDPSTYRASFATALATRLASLMAFNRTESVSAAKDLLTQYQVLALPKAMAADFQRDAQPKPLQGAWEYARLGGNVWFPI